MTTTSFSVSGQRDGRLVTLTWTDGELSGDDPATVAWVKELAQLLEGTMQGQLGGPYTMTDHLASPYTARAIMRSVFRGPTTFSGALPTIELPPGAVM